MILIFIVYPFIFVLISSILLCHRISLVVPFHHRLSALVVVVFVVFLVAVVFVVVAFVVVFAVVVAVVVAQLLQYHTPNITYNQFCW